MSDLVSDETCSKIPGSLGVVTLRGEKGGSVGNQAHILHSSPGAGKRNRNLIQLFERIRRAKILLQRGHHIRCDRSSVTRLQRASFWNNDSVPPRFDPTSPTSTTSNGPTANATRYEEIGLVCANSTRLTSELSYVSLSIGVLENAFRSFGTNNMRDHFALKDGSSKQGTALRAVTGSNFVNTYHSSLYFC